MANGIFPMLAQIAIKNGVPFLTNMMIEKMNHANQKKIHNLETQRIIKIKNSLYSPGQTNGQATGQTTSLTKGFLPQETIEDLGRRKWNEYHSKLDSLPDNASEIQVHNALQEIVDNIKIYPCLTCRENAIKNLQKFPLITPQVKTKKEAQKRMCGYHNIVREMLGKPIIHNCDVN